MIVVLMGVSGSGKTTIGRLLASRTGWIFADADDYFPRLLKQKMAAAIPLTDEDREPWLKLLNRLLRTWERERKSGVLACSALKSKYQKMLEMEIPASEIRFIFLDGSRELIAKRLAERTHEYMNPKLLDSQLAALEPPDGGLHVVNDRTPDEVVAQILTHVSPVLGLA